jgi:hypothetical protein
MLFRVTHNDSLKLFNLANVAWIEHDFDHDADLLEQQFLNVLFVGSDLVQKFCIDEDTVKRFDALWHEAR